MCSLLFSPTSVRLRIINMTHDKPYMVWTLQFAAKTGQGTQCATRLEAERDQAKLERRRPAWNKPKLGKLEAPLPRPMLNDPEASEEGRSDEGDADEKDGDESDE
ncbi:hypothetical protein BDR07DRAFT_1457088 [Suillus spraguei]|nr:hypothetical protein BDR07DRAFT_1457088 [Suillus spraguei]